MTPVRDPKYSNVSQHNAAPEIFDPADSVEKISLMIVDDDYRFRERLGRSLSRRGYEVHTFADGASAIEHARLNSAELALVDLRLQGEWGLNIVAELLTVDPETRVVVLTAYGSIATAIEAVRLGAKNYLQKPVGVEEIERALLQDFEEVEADIGKERSTVQNNEPIEVPSLAKVEWEYINRVLTECGGNIRKTAAALGMHRRTLQRKLSKYPSKS